MSFALARHGYRSANDTTPQLTLLLGPTVEPNSVEMPFYDGTFSGDLLPDVLSRTLPDVTNEVKKIIKQETHKEKIYIKGYTDASLSRTFETAVAWVDYLRGIDVCGVVTEPNNAVDPRVSNDAAELNLDNENFIASQQAAALLFKEKAHKQWKKLLVALGFKEVSAPANEYDEIPTNSKDRALYFLQLPAKSYDFGTAVIMAFGLERKTAKEVLRQANWPKPKQSKNQKKWFKAAADLMGTIMAVWYPSGSVANTMSAPLAYLAVNWFKEKEKEEEKDTSKLLVAVSHEEPNNYFRATLGLGLFYYALPTSCMLFIKHENILKVYVVHNEVTKSGKISKKAKSKKIGDIPFEKLQKLASIQISPLPDFVCATFQ